MKTKNMTTPSLRNSISRPPLRRGLPRKQQLLRTQAMWIIRGFLLIPLALACPALAPCARATCEQGCDTTHNNTFLGNDALLANTTGTFNTATGGYALAGNTIGYDNTASGFDALYKNTDGLENTAAGAYAL